MTASGAASGRPRVVVVGSANVDTVADVPRLPSAGETVTASAVVTGGGGKGLNQAVAAARAGGEVAMVARVGDDAGGRALSGLLAEAGVATGAVRRCEGVPTGVALVTVGPGGANTIVVGPGANHRLSAQDAVAWPWPDPDVVLVQQEIPHAAVVAALRAGRAAGATTILNPAPAPGPLAPDVLALVDVLVPNETELAALTPGGGTFEARIGALRDGGAGAVVVTVGLDGAVVSGGGSRGEERIPGFAVEARDTTAAGDTFCGFLAVELGRGAPMAAAVRRAVAAAGLGVTVAGAAASIPTAAAVDDFLAGRPPT